MCVCGDLQDSHTCVLGVVMHVVVMGWWPEHAAQITAHIDPGPKTTDHEAALVVGKVVGMTQ